MSRTAYLTADLGNSALKVVVWECAEGGEARVADLLGVRVGTDIPRTLGAWLSRHAHLVGAAFSSVGPLELETAVRTVLMASAQERLLAPPDWGGGNGCREPDRVGQDRLFAARGAWECIDGPAVVVDAGTALTVDALIREPERRGPYFLGGAIAPGPRLLAAALATGGSRLFAVEPDPAAGALGRDTREALLAGVGVGFVGAARYLVERVADAAGIGSAPVVLTGGELTFLRTAGTFPGREVHVRALLVHEGLLAAGTESTLGERWRPAANP